MTKAILAIIAFYLIFGLWTGSVSAQSVNMECSNISGVSLVKTSSSFKATKDGFRNTTINISASGNNWNIRWSGQTNLRDSAMLIPNHGPHRFTAVSFASNEVIRMYTLFSGGSLAISEHQLQLVTNQPQSRSYFGFCRQL